MIAKKLTIPSFKKNLLGLAVILIIGLLSSCGNNDNGTSVSNEFDDNVTLARKNCTQSDAEEKKQCLISYLGCSAVTGDVTCDD